MTNKAKQIKKLIFTNQYTFQDISNILDLPIEKCISEFESYYKTQIPPSLLIVGNKKQRGLLKQHIQSCQPVYLYGFSHTLISNYQSYSYILKLLMPMKSKTVFPPWLQVG